MKLEQPAAARVLADPQARRFLEPFIGRERTVGAVAAEVGVEISSVLYRVRRFIDLGLLRLERSEPRHGRAVKYYRAVADGFFAPFAATPFVTPEEFSPKTFRPWQHALEEGIGRAWIAAATEELPLGLHVYRDEAGKIHRDVIPEPESRDPEAFFARLLEAAAPAVWDDWHTIYLEDAEAKALQRELATLVERYRPKEQTGKGREYIVRLAMAPKADD